MKNLIISIVMLLTTCVSNIWGQNIAFTYDADGNMESRYEVTLQAAPAHTSETTGIASVALSDYQITIYPNPTQGRIKIAIEPAPEATNNFLRLYDAGGKLLQTQAIVSGETELEITGDTGVYLLNIHLGDKVSKWKIIKQ
ncbi:hypothetical protein FACS189413_18830 [Bacteroidia bacterium]|nr:hypothetical protein FACS189413_18830 [Bacteroidia bacterium]